MKLRILKVKDLPVPNTIRVIKEKAGNQFQYFNEEGLVGRAPCRSNIRKLTPEMVMARAELCTSFGWEYCNLVDEKGNVLDSMTYKKARTTIVKKLFNEITLNRKDLPPVQGMVG